jgi:hypothetical protein
MQNQGRIDTFLPLVLKNVYGTEPRIPPAQSAGSVCLVLIGMNSVANQTQLLFEIAGVEAYEGSAQNNQARS